VRILGAWFVIVPLVSAAVAYVMRGLDFSGDETLAQMGISPWALEGNSHFMAQAAVRAAIGVACSAWLLLRASAKQAVRA
jgi:hypothetical protein